MSAVLEPGSLERPHTPAARARLGAEVLRTYLRVRWLLWRHDLPAVVATLERPGSSSPSPPSDSAALASGARLARASGRCLAHLPTDARCLVQSLVLLALMARRGIAAALVIGVRPGGEFGAHAWIERDGLPLLPAGGEDYERLVELGSQGNGSAG